MKKLFFILSFMISVTFLYSQNELNSLNTVLIIVDEEENNSFVTEATPFTDGIFKAMWEKEYIFFDLRLEDPIKVVSNNLEVGPFIGAAKSSGADSILLIKIAYSSKKEGYGLRITATDLYYNIYSLNSMKTIKSGKKKININQRVDNVEQKNAFLKNTGFDILYEIYE
ncbi:MAG TPA: hypothetical protein PK771_09480 [Spirochaetota bacterium]|nr:hypothetical protein [Spirochaetota bacterium]